MTLDNEDQRKLILQIISVTQINGNYQQAKAAVTMLDELRETVEKAKIELH